MICGTRSVAVPMKFALGFLDRQVIDAGMAMPHQAILVEFPVLVAVGAEPVAGIVAIFIGEAHRDTVVSECPEFLDKAVLELAIPFTSKKLHDLVAPLEDFAAIAP